MDMKRSQRIALLVITCIAAAAAGQQSSPPFSTHQEVQDPTPVSHETVTVDFPGGTLEQYMEALRAATATTPINVVIAPEVAGVRIPRVKLAKALPSSAVFSVTQIGTNKAGKPVTLNVVQLDNGASAPAYSISLYEDREKLARSNDVLVLSLNPIIGLPDSRRERPSALDAKAVLSAIEVGVQVADGSEGEPAVLKFHEPSGLLFVRGSTVQQRAAEEVVAKLRKDVETERAAEFAATAGRATEKVQLKSGAPDTIAQQLRQKFSGRCCVQFEVDGTFLIVKGDRALVNEAVQVAYLLDGSPLNKQSKDPNAK